MPSRQHGRSPTSGSRRLFGVLLVALKDFQAGLQQALQLGIGRRRDQLRFQAPLTALW
jgi:hypothetical protein